MTASAAAVSIIMHTLCIITRYNFTIGRSRTRREVDREDVDRGIRFLMDRDGEMSVRFGIIFGGIRDVFFCTSLWTREGE